jgi:hypothetical protein
MNRIHSHLPDSGECRKQLQNRRKTEGFAGRGYKLFSTGKEYCFQSEGLGRRA